MNTEKFPLAEEMGWSSTPSNLQPYASTDSESRRIAEGLTMNHSFSEKTRLQSVLSGQTLSNHNTSASPHKECSVHGASETPLLQAHFEEPRTKASMQALSSLLAEAVEEGMCLKCGIEAATETVRLFLRDFRRVGKKGKWSREEKKALKSEAKLLKHDMKHTIKRSWKDRH